MARKDTPLTPASFQTLGELLGFLRERAHITQRQLAARVSYHYSYISRIEKNQHTPTISTLIGRFVPALEIQDEPEWMERLVELASRESQETTKLPNETETAIPEIKVYRPPASLTSILGREEESKQLIKSLGSEEVRIITIVGPPGVGKTRLSLHVAEQIAKQFKSGVVVVDLAPIPHFAMVLWALAEALGIQETPEASLQVSLESFLQNKHLLIVFDNFEQVLPSASALIDILYRAPHVKMMITSREALRAPGEYELHLAPLPLPEPKEVRKKDVENSPAIQLFVQRARAAKPGFQLTDENASRVAEICYRLDGLPLAIELAASRIQTLSLNAMLSQFEKRFSWLTRGRSDIPEWRQTLSGAITWSYQLLTESERVLFHRLSVFEGGWTLEAAEKICSDNEVCQPSEIFNLLLRLTDRSLVVAEPGDDETRYRFLVTIRHFAQEKHSQTDEYERTRAFHLSYYAAWAEQIKSAMNKMSPVEFRHAVEVESNNIFTSLEWSLKESTELENSLNLVSAIGSIWLKLSHFKQALEWVETFLPHTTDDKYKHHRARLLYLKCALTYWHDNLSIATEAGLDAERIARELNDKKLLADILYYLGGGIHRERAELSKAQMCLEESVALCHETRYFSRLSLALTGLSTVTFQQGKKEEADVLVKEAIQIATRENDLWAQNHAIRVQADHLHLEGHLEESLNTYKRALDMSLVTEDHISAGMQLANMALIANVLEDYTASGNYAKSAISIFQMIGSEYQQPFPQRMMAYSAMKAGDLDLARSYLTESLRGNQKLGHQAGILSCLIAFAELEYMKQNFLISKKLFKYVNEQLQKQQLQLLEPDETARKRLEVLKSNVHSKKLNKAKGIDEFNQLLQELSLKL